MLLDAPSRDCHFGIEHVPLESPEEKHGKPMNKLVAKNSPGHVCLEIGRSGYLGSAQLGHLITMRWLEDSVFVKPLDVMRLLNSIDH